jgi:hypothetical protein
LGGCTSPLKSTFFSPDSWEKTEGIRLLAPWDLKAEIVDLSGEESDSVALWSPVKAGEGGRTIEEDWAEVPQWDQIAFFRSSIGTGARRNPAACGTNQGTVRKAI